MLRVVGKGHTCTLEWERRDLSGGDVLCVMQTSGRWTRRCFGIDPMSCAMYEEAVNSRHERLISVVADPCPRWEQEPQTEGARVEAIARILEAGMIEEVDSIQPKMGVCLLPSPHPQLLAREKEKSVNLGL